MSDSKNLYIIKSGEDIMVCRTFVQLKERLTEFLGTCNSLKKRFIARKQSSISKSVDFEQLRDIMESLEFEDRTEIAEIKAGIWAETCCECERFNDCLCEIEEDTDDDDEELEEEEEEEEFEYQKLCDGSIGCRCNSCVFC